MKENKDKEPKVYDVPAAGSLALLALGYHGLEIWRKKRAEAELDAKNINPEGSGEKNNSDK